MGTLHKVAECFFVYFYYLTREEKCDKMAGRLRSLRPEFLLYHSLSYFVKRNFAQTLCLWHPETLCILTIDFHGRMGYTNNVKREMKQPTSPRRIIGCK